MRRSTRQEIHGEREIQIRGDVNATVEPDSTGPARDHHGRQ